MKSPVTSSSLPSRVNVPRAMDSKPRLTGTPPLTDHIEDRVFNQVQQQAAPDFLGLKPEGADIGILAEPEGAVVVNGIVREMPLEPVDQATLLCGECLFREMRSRDVTLDRKLHAGVVIDRRARGRSVEHDPVQGFSVDTHVHMLDHPRIWRPSLRDVWCRALPDLEGFEIAGPDRKLGFEAEPVLCIDTDLVLYPVPKQFKSRPRVGCPFSGTIE